MTSNGQKQDLGLGGPELWGGVCGEGVPLPIVKGHLPRFFCYFFRVSKCVFGAFSGPREYLFLGCNTSRRAYCVFWFFCLTFRANCGSVKGAGAPAEENTEHMVIYNKFNHCQHQYIESRRQNSHSFSSATSVGEHGLFWICYWPVTRGVTHHVRWDCNWVWLLTTDVTSARTCWYLWTTVSSWY